MKTLNQHLLELLRIKLSNDDRYLTEDARLQEAEFRATQILIKLAEDLIKKGF